MTFGQLSVWRSVSGHGHSDPAAATLQRKWTFPADITEKQLEEALTALEARHESLRTVYDTDSLTQLVLPPREAGSARLADAAQAARLRIDPATDYPWAYSLSREDASAPWTVTVAVHHIASDGWGCDLMERELRWYLEHGPWTEPAPQPRDLAGVQQQRRERLSPRLIEYWSRVLDGRKPYEADGGRSDWAVLTSYDSLRGALLAQARHSVSLHTIALSAFLQLLRSHGDDDPLVALIASNRFSPTWHGLVSSLNQIVPLAVRLEGDERVDLARLQAASLRAYRYAMFDVDELELALADSGFNGTGRGFSNFFNYAELSEAAMPTSEGSRMTVSHSGRDNGFPVYLRVTVADSMEFTLKRMHGFLSDDVGAMAGMLESTILSLAA